MKFTSICGFTVPTRVLCEPSVCRFSLQPQAPKETTTPPLLESGIYADSSSPVGLSHFNTYFTREKYTQNPASQNIPIIHYLVRALPEGGGFFLRLPAHHHVNNEHSLIGSIGHIGGSERTFACKSK